MKRINIKKLFIFIFFTIFYFAMQVLQGIFNNNSLAPANGILLAFCFISCLVMILTNYKVGTIITACCMGVSSLRLLTVIIASHGKSFYPIAGLVNTILFFITLFILVAQFKKRDEQIVTDFLTNLYNRRGLYKILNEKTGNKESFYVVYIALSNFKLINDKYGHVFGDEIIKSISEKMLSIIGKDGVAARLNGDEFVLILKENSKVYQITQNILDEITSKTVLTDTEDHDVEIYVTSHAGISKYPADTEDPEDLIKFADIAMYEASRNKQTRIVRFDQDMADKLNRQMEVEKLINEGLENDYFYMVYQPQYYLDGKKLRGFESLLRLKTPEGVAISPAEFIPVAEKKDLILKIDDYVIQRVMNEFKDIVASSKDNLTISINVSAKNIGSFDFPKRIKKYLDKTGYPAANLEIEITEYCLVQSVETTIENIHQLREMGIQVALDDFGTGYTSLSYLSKMPINLLKIDKSLIDDIELNEKNQDFVNAVISMGHIMGCEVIAEGVENEIQLGTIQEQKCDFVQGFVWGKPMEYIDAKNLVL